MSFYLRKVKASGWDGNTTVDDEWRARGAADLRLRPLEEALSVFEANSDDERNRTAAAIALGNREARPIVYLEISEEELREVGRLERDGNGDTPLADVNKRHVSLYASPASLVQLAEKLRSSGRAAVRLGWADVILPVLREIDPDALVGHEAEQSASWLRERTRPRER